MHRYVIEGKMVLWRTCLKKEKKRLSQISQATEEWPADCM